MAQPPDGPGIWAVDARDRRRYAEPSDDSMAEVLAVAAGLLDPNEERNKADPYVVAMAYELRERYPDHEVCVATENTVDRPPLVSPGTACEWLNLLRIRLPRLLAVAAASRPAFDRAGHQRRAGVGQADRSGAGG